MTDLLTKTREINTLLQQKNTFDMQADLPYSKMVTTLGGILDSNTYIIGNDRVLLGYNEHHDVNDGRIKAMFVEKQFPGSYTDTVTQLMKTEANIPITSNITAFPVESREKYPFGLTIIVPIFRADERLGTITLSRMEQSFTDDDLVLAEYGATVVGTQTLYQESRSIEADVRNAAVAQMAINILSYSELKAMQAISEALDGDEGHLTTSNIADSIGITRSVIANALRKLGSVGIIESRSLGMRGTYLKVLNSRFRDELAKHSYQK